MAKVPQPKWTELRAKYISPGRPKVAGVCLHDTAGSGTHNDTRYLASPGDGRRVSVDFTVERDGSIWKLNPDLTKYHCSHAGRKTKFKGYVNGQCNRVLIGIEIVQKANLSLKPIYPDAQVKSVAQLCAWLTDKFNLVTSDITTHRNIITDGSRSDPRQFPWEGPKGFWQYFWEAKGKGDDYGTATVIQKTPDPTKSQRTYTVAAGDSLYAIAKKYYGNGALAPIIDMANNLKNGLILPGQVLVIPETNEKGEAYGPPSTAKKPSVKKSTAKKAATKKAAAKKAVAKKVAAKKAATKEASTKQSSPAPKPQRTHTVVAGDTLYGLAKKYYGKGDLYPLIDKANALKNGAIHPGQVLKIPDEK